MPAAAQGGGAPQAARGQEATEVVGCGAEAI